MKNITMTLAFAATLATSVMGVTFTPTVSECGATKASECEFVGFDFKETGKIATELTKKGYKTVQTFKTTKGAIGLVFAGESTPEETEASTNDTEEATNSTEDVEGDVEATECCDNPVSVTMVTTMKLNGEKVTTVFRELGITRLSFFGKNWEKVEDVIDGVGKSGKYYEVESDLGWVTGGVDGVEPVSPANLDIDEEAVFVYSGFGKAKIGLSKLTKAGGNCGTKSGGCDPDLVFKSYKGYFAGFTTCEDCLGVYDYTCDSRCGIAIFGGTWTAKFNKKFKSEAQMLQKFGVTLNDD
jgi:hypothetical protein